MIETVIVLLVVALPVVTVLIVIAMTAALLVKQRSMKVPTPPPLPIEEKPKWSEKELLRTSPASWVEEAEKLAIKQASRASYYKGGMPPGHPWNKEKAELERAGWTVWLEWMEE